MRPNGPEKEAVDIRSRSLVVQPAIKTMYRIWGYPSGLQNLLTVEIARHQALPAMIGIILEICFSHCNTMSFIRYTQVFRYVLYVS
jgi:hypothetical protein